jgi:preprotein translocase subunit SecE
MNSKVEQHNSSSAGDILKFALAVLVAVAGVVGFYWFAEWPGTVRGAALVVVLVLAAAIAMFTAKGRALREYFAEARFELRKVVWPTRQETIRATGLILIVVVIISLLLGAMDMVISWAIRLLLG